MMFGAEHDAIVGDCHIKTASSTTLPFFCVKLATGFYNNPAQGLPVNNGLLMLLSSKTGQPVSLFRDGGHMTSVRTAAAGARARARPARRAPRAARRAVRSMAAVSLCM